MLKKGLFLILVIMAAFGVLLLTTQSSTFEVRDSRVIHQKTDRVWQVLTEVERWSQWWPGVETARLGSCWAEGESLELLLKGNPANGPARIDRYQLDHELVFSRAGVLGSRAGTGFLFEALPGAVRVTVETTVSGPQAFLARFTGRAAFSAYHQRLLDGLSERVRHNGFSGIEKEVRGGP